MSIDNTTVELGKARKSNVFKKCKGLRGKSFTRCVKAGGKRK